MIRIDWGLDDDRLVPSHDANRTSMNTAVTVTPSQAVNFSSRHGDGSKSWSRVYRPAGRDADSAKSESLGMIPAVVLRYIMPVILELGMDSGLAREPASDSEAVAQAVLVRPVRAA
jgi:hypothetical protein